MLGPTRVEPGCLFCRLYEDVETAGTLTLVEEWSSLLDFERRLRSEAYRQLLLLMELSPEAPVIQFHSVHSTAGMDAILAARSRPMDRDATGSFGTTSDVAAQTRGGRRLDVEPPNNWIHAHAKRHSHRGDR
jgi:hypothetical protein